MRIAGPMRSVRILAAAALATAAAVAPLSAGEDAYLDDRSTAESLVRSLYNAVNRHEYLRAWSYFSEESGRADYETFAKGYEGTDHVRVRIGESFSEGAAGSLYASVPVAVEATDDSGDVSVFAGCYRTRLAQPAVQATPPFQPLTIIGADLDLVQVTLEKAKGRCQNGQDG